MFLIVIWKVRLQTELRQTQVSAHESVLKERKIPCEAKIYGKTEFLQLYWATEYKCKSTDKIEFKTAVENADLFPQDGCVLTLRCVRVEGIFFLKKAFWSEVSYGLTREHCG